ncbi:hypothetical protein BKA65DRAFT_604235 [Rhexocercosporidium sp. MPI-PUGE-AT-0058]|nr:hypothetical protein BKA65DRAFT_604235 [Rhexocercosporidium sp. MPI-PUGE-AT-0058]
MSLIRLLQRKPDGEIVFREPTSSDVPAYVILSYTWGEEEIVDTCCIDKKNAVELSAAINCMFRWYQNASRCYVYLMDVEAFRKSRWFTRGWTLQELLAPRSVEFFSQDGKRLGDKNSLDKQIHRAANRKTTIEEDQVYSLLGIFNMYLTLIYSEGKQHALRRL